MIDQEKGESAELSCVHCFIQWFSPQYNTKYDLLRPEEIYPDLKDRLRWDFVILPTNATEKQRIAVEVKRIIRPTILTQHSQWQGILNQVNYNLKNTLRGKYDILTFANLNPQKGTRYHVLRITHKDRARFISVITDVIEKNIINLAKSEVRDLGPQMLSQFPTWPVRYSGNVPQACEFFIIKTSDQGSQIRLSDHDAFFEGAALKEAIERLDMNSQLDLARQRGIEHTILLLDLNHEFDWAAAEVTKILSDKIIPSISNIYLIQVPAKIEQVWPAKRGKH